MRGSSDLRIPDTNQAFDDESGVFRVSALDGSGCSELRDALVQHANLLTNGMTGNGLVSLRQVQELRDCASVYRQAVENWLQGEPAELVSIDLRMAHGCMARILGRVHPDEDVLDRVFSKFCVGK